MTRWRVTLWLIDRPELRRKVHRQSACKLCMIMLAMRLAQETATSHRRTVECVAWDVERLSRVVDGWDIVYTSRMPQLKRVTRHAH